MGEHIVESECSDNPIPKLFTITGFYPGLNGDAIIQMDYEGDVYNAHISDIFLICHPLSDLTEEIIIKGYNDDKPFVPIEHLFNVEHGVIDWEEIGRGRPDLHGIVVRLHGKRDKFKWNRIGFLSLHKTSSYSFCEIQMLAKWNFWLYDQKAFKEGVIIDINSLK
jgi:hypothetical protein